MSPGRASGISVRALTLRRNQAAVAFRAMLTLERGSGSAAMRNLGASDTVWSRRPRTAFPSPAPCSAHDFLACAAVNSLS
jgi:hypothetical protein